MARRVPPAPRVPGVPLVQLAPRVPLARRAPRVPRVLAVPPVTLGPRVSLATLGRVARRGRRGRPVPRVPQVPRAAQAFEASLVTPACPVTPAPPARQARTVPPAPPVPRDPQALRVPPVPLVRLGPQARRATPGRRGQRVPLVRIFLNGVGGKVDSMVSAVEQLASPWHRVWCPQQHTLAHAQRPSFTSRNFPIQFAIRNPFWPPVPCSQAVPPSSTWATAPLHTVTCAAPYPAPYLCLGYFSATNQQGIQNRRRQ